MNQEITYAIDFGTSNSLLAGSKSGKSFDPIELDPKVIDKTILRSLIYFPRDGQAHFGQSAIDSYVEENGDGRFIRSIKKYLPAKSFSGTQINGKQYKLEELIARFLKEMKTRADQQLNCDVKKVVLGRPALFSWDKDEDKLAEERLYRAAIAAGFSDISFFAEPLAAAFSYKKELTSEKLVLVVDLGGGTSDFTVIRVGPQKYNPNDVLSIGGISIAGDILDGCIMENKIAPHFGSQVKYRFPLSDNILTMPPSLKSRLSSPADITLMAKSDIMYFLDDVRRSTVGEQDKERLNQLFELIAGNLGFAIFEKIESAKKALSISERYKFLFEEDNIVVHENLTYSEFLEYTKDKISSIFKTLDQVLTSAGVTSSEIDSICCTGGTSKLPAIKAGLLKRFGEDKIHSYKNFHSVISGLAERATQLS